MVEYSGVRRIKNLPRFLILIIIIVGLFLAAYYLGFTREFCGKDQNCFSQKAASCSPAEVFVSRNNNIFYYQINPTIRNQCKLIVKFERAQEGTLQEHTELLEGKSMKCYIPKSEMRRINVIEMENIIGYCSGELKEGLYELIIKRMYELIITNLGSITEEAQKAMKV